MTELEKAAEAREIDICQYSANDCLNTNGCHRCQWGVPSLDLRCSNNASFKLGAQWQAEQSPWIRTEEKTPEDKELVLTSSGIYGTKLLVWNDHYKVWDDEDGDDCYCERDKIDAWMPIPE